MFRPSDSRTPRYALGHAFFSVCVCVLPFLYISIYSFLFSSAILVAYFVLFRDSSPLVLTLFVSAHPQGFTPTRTQRKGTRAVCPALRSPKIWSSTRTYASARWWNTYRRPTRWRALALQPPTSKGATARFTCLMLAASRNARDLISRKHSKVPLIVLTAVTSRCWPGALLIRLVFYYPLGRHPPSPLTSYIFIIYKLGQKGTNCMLARKAEISSELTKTKKIPTSLSVLPRVYFPVNNFGFF